MTSDWMQNGEIPLFIFDARLTLRFWNDTANIWSTDRLSLNVGMTPADLDALGLAGIVDHPDLADLNGRAQGEALNVTVPETQMSVLVIPLTALSGEQYRVLALLPSDAAAHSHTELIDRVFDWMMQQAERSSDLEQRMTARGQQIVQSEKMAAIGQLAAGVAHEINNPIGYINSNLNTLSHYVSQLVSLGDFVENASSLDEVKAQLAVMDFDFLRQDIQDCIHESAEGASRVRDIIAALKDFSHADDGRIEECDLTEVFQSTLKLVHNELKYHCTVHEEYGDLPLVSCNINQIKQVAMNLIINASQAIEQQGNLWIRTGCTGNGVWFEIEDDGPGIAREHFKRVFEPFFTTKPVGEGTGLGLSLSYNIMQRHEGTLEFESSQGSGTRFRGWLPG
jgi:signal transduction histidine kinase